MPLPTPGAEAKTTYWTAVQSVEWIATRNLARVARPAHNLGSLKVRADLYDYMRTTGWSSKQATNQEPYVSHLDALAQLLEQCRNGKVTVRGLNRGKGESEEIPVYAWKDRIIGDTMYGVVCFVDDGFSNETWWDGLQFLRTEIQSCWPSGPRSNRKIVTASEKPKAVKSRSKYSRKALRDEFAKWKGEQLASGVRIREADAYAAMKERVSPTVTRQAVRELLRKLPVGTRFTRGRPRLK